MILSALFYGALVGAAFPLGALLAKLNPFGHRGFAAAMGFGAGLLLAAALTDLAVKSGETLGAWQAGAVLLAAAALYSAINHWLSQRGAKHRKRCGGCVAPDSEAETLGSGMSIAIGSVMDALPEALVLGVIASSGEPGAGLLAALVLGNTAQSMSATSGLQESGRSTRFIALLWGGLFFGVIALTLLACLLTNGMAGVPRAVLMAVAAGVLIAMIAEAMLPEATEEFSPFIGLVTASGAVAFLLMH